MFEILIAIIVVLCIMYIFKGEFFRKRVGVTVVESLPLTIFKKSNNTIDKEESNKNIENDNFKVKEIQYNKEENSKINEEVIKNHRQDNIANNTDIEESILEVACASFNDEENNTYENDAKLVYWTPRGKTYHVKSTCRTLIRSKIINSGTIDESGKNLKCEHCK